NDFGRCMADLNFAVVVSSAIERKDESERIDKVLKEVEESFKEVGDKLDDGFKQVGNKFDAAVVQHIDFMQMTKQGDAIKIDSSELSDPMTQNIRGKVFKITYKSLIEPELQISIPAIRQRLEELANKFPIPHDAPSLLKNEQLEFEVLKSGESLLEINDCSEIEEEVPEEVDVIPLKDCIDMHKKKEYKSAWESFKQNAELNDPVTKFWVGYYLCFGHHGEKDLITSRKYFKEVADENNYSEAQCKYVVLLIVDLSKETDETAKDIYMNGKLKVKRDVIRGLNCLRLAASVRNERAILRLKI
ncbi:24832_t:CDS:2, partial [Gigaspora margarita]